MRHAGVMVVRESREEQSATLRAVLRDVQVAEYWQPNDPTYLIDIAVRRWTSFDRRSKPGKRTPGNQVQDLLRGLREAQGEDIHYQEPGWLEHVAERFGAALLAAGQARDASANSDQGR
jgi:hypothetical protein